MSTTGLEWTRWAGELRGPHFADVQAALTTYNTTRLQPMLPDEAPADELSREQAVARAEVAFIEAQRREIAPLVADIPSAHRRLHRVVRGAEARAARARAIRCFPGSPSARASSR